MTKRFWFHLVTSWVLAIAVSWFIWVFRGSIDAIPAGQDVGSAGSRAGVVLALLGFLFVLARLLLRVTGSDRATGLLGLYAVALCVPFMTLAATSIVPPIVFLLVAGAVLELIDVAIAPGNAARSGFYLSLACVLDPSVSLIAAALLPLCLALARRRLTAALSFALAVALPWAAVLAVPALAARAASLQPLEDSLTAFGLRSASRVAMAKFAELRASWDGGFQSAYAAFCLVALLAATVRRLGPSRRGIAATGWLLLVTAVAAGVLSPAPGPLFPALGYLLFVTLANAGLAALAAMNPLHAGRRRMFPVGVFFILPLVVAWMKLFV
jgi:hypothetical protein